MTQLMQEYIQEKTADPQSKDDRQTIKKLKQGFHIDSYFFPYSKKISVAP
jgi:hypothetical protein